MKKATFISLFITLCMVVCGCSASPVAKSGEKIPIDKEEFDGLYAELSFELGKDFYSADASYSGVCRFGVYDSKNKLIDSCPFNSAALASNGNSIVYIQEDNDEKPNTGVTFAKEKVLSYVKTEIDDKKHYILYATYQIEGKKYVSFYCYHEEVLRPISDTDIEISGEFAHKEDTTFSDSKLNKTFVIDIATHSLMIE